MLDLGCGTGIFSCLLEEQNLVVSLDISTTSARITQQNRMKKGLCLTARIESLPFPQDTFDIVLAFNLIEHLENERVAVEEITRLLKVSGKVLVMVPEDMSLFSKMDIADGHFRRYSRQDLLRLFSNLQTEVLSDFGYPFMRLYLRVLGRLHDRVMPPNNKPTLLMKVTSKILVLIFSLDFCFNGSFIRSRIIRNFQKG